MLRLQAATVLVAGFVSTSAWAEEKPLPDGPGKATVQALCAGCHEMERSTNANYTAQEWKTVIDMMVNFGVPIPKNEIETVANYFIKNYPERPKPTAVVVPGPAEVAFKEWQVPTPGSRPHDPLATPDGAIWYTGQMANVLGRLDPKTGQIKEYPVKRPQSGPHGLVNDRDGNIWFTANAATYIGRLDPKTGAVTEYPMPDAKVRDPHTLLFDANGILWFTAQNGNAVGRLDPASGGIQTWFMPSPRSRPYGMVINSKGTVFFDEFGAPKIASIDPETTAITEYQLPDAGSRPRRIAITSDDVIWYTDFALGRLGRLDTKTGKVTEYASPSGAKSQPYGISVVKDVIWYSESGTRPNTLVRFDPKTEKFQTWIIPSGGGVVRNMVTMPDGNLALACSAVNGLALVEIKK